MPQNGIVAEQLKATYENITEEFITGTMYTLLCDKKKTNLKMRFTEPEAMNFIKNILHKFAQGGEYWRRKTEAILKEIEQNESETIPTIIVRDYQDFFKQLTLLCEENINQFFKRTGMSGFPWYERINCMEEVWLRMAPEDFANPENFLRQQVEMAQDTTFNKYDKEKCLGKVQALGGNVLCIQNKVARTWDEASQEMQIIIYDKECYNNSNYIYKPHYVLPVVRYGIFEKCGKKVCRIYSVQNTESRPDNDNVHKNINRAKYKVNDGVNKEDTEKIEPKNLIALSVFVNLLNQEGIEHIEAQGVYALDYEFHVKRGARLKKDFDERWTQEKISEKPSMYEREKEYLEKTYNKEDLISEIKTERFIRTFTRLLQHYPAGEITSYPTELDSNLHLTIPKLKNKSEINGQLLQELYELVQRQYETFEIQ